MGANPQPDLILLKGKVITLGKKNPVADAVAIKGDRILAVGANEDIKALKGARTKLIDLRGRVVVPGFVTLTRTSCGGGSTSFISTSATRRASSRCWRPCAGA